MLAGRDISTSKMAFSSCRVMGTCAVGGQASGTAAALAVRHGCDPREIGEKHIRELQQLLLKNDCYIPGHRNTDESDLARSASVSATSETAGGEAVHVINGYSRAVGKASNCWISAPLTQPQSLTLTLSGAAPVQEVRLTFDTDLSHEIQPSLIKNVKKRQVKGLPHELVRDYDVELLLGGAVVAGREMRDNGQRLNRLAFDGTVCDAVRVTVRATHGCPEARIFEIRVY